MTPRHFFYALPAAPPTALPAAPPVAPARPRRARPQHVRPYDLSHITWAHAFPDS